MRLRHCGALLTFVEIRNPIPLAKIHLAREQEIHKIIDVTGLHKFLLKIFL